MPAALQLAQDALVGHLALEVLDGAVEAAVTDDDLYGLALNGFSNRLLHAFPRSSARFYVAGCVE